MNRTQRAILESYKGFLAQNIIWTDNLYSYLGSYGLLAESMLDDIKVIYFLLSLIFNQAKSIDYYLSLLLTIWYDWFRLANNRDKVILREITEKF